MNNKVELINFCVDSNIENIDADDLGSRFVDLVSKINADTLYLLKVRISEPQIPRSVAILKSLANMFRERDINNIVIVPIAENWIEDITIEEVRITNENQ